MKALAAAALAAALAACAHAPPRERTVIVEGAAALGADGPAGARARALADARLRALEQGGGVHVSAVTLARDGLVAAQRVRSSSGGTLRGVRVLAEARRDGQLVLQVRATVRGDGAAPPPTLYVEGPEPARGALRRRWVERGGELAPSAAEAELVARASMGATPQPDARLAPFRSWQARVRVDADGGTAGWDVEREASALGLDDAQARHEAVERAAAEAADALARLPRRGL